ncbi:hypothetical protein RCC89_20270 [Cytophagaceae bacterium ABcell3]|nr:hypothetical protein RCC89_20270 [Cytophagaceae bacterium ABcell3]
MLSLEQDLQRKKNTLQEFKDITLRVLNYLPHVLSSSEKKGDYLIYSSIIAETKKYLRPINYKLFINNPDRFSEGFEKLLEVNRKIKSHHLTFSSEEKNTINSVLYTIQQSIGAGLDLLVNPNSGRKHAGNRFEELIKVVFSEIGIPNKRVVLKIPYETDQGVKNYVCENDLILSPEGRSSSSTSLDENEIVVSVKTTSKDRMGKIFIDKILLERFVKHKLKFIGIFLNDVQRKEQDNISFTLVSGLFMVYNKFLTPLDGVYYLDPPPNAQKEPYNAHIKPFSELITTDLTTLLSTS